MLFYIVMMSLINWEFSVIEEIVRQKNKKLVPK
jgi:hypothetical protein